ITKVTRPCGPGDRQLSLLNQSLAGFAARWRDLVEGTAPLPAIRRTGDIHHTQTVIFGVAARVANDDHVVARLQSLAGNALTAELAACAPFNGPALHHALVVRRFDVDEGVRVAIQE